MALRAVMYHAFFKVPADKLIEGQECGDSGPSLNPADEFYYLVFAVSYPTRDKRRMNIFHGKRRDITNVASNAKLKVHTNGLFQSVIVLPAAQVVEEKHAGVLILYNVTVSLECTSAEEKCIIIWAQDQALLTRTLDPLRGLLAK